MAPFMCCLLVLRTIRRTDEMSFVLHLSVSVGVLPTIVGIEVLVDFIHHVSVSIQADEVVARVGRELKHGNDRLFRATLAGPDPKAHKRRAKPACQPRSQSRPVPWLPSNRAISSGSMQTPWSLRFDRHGRLQPGRGGPRLQGS